MQSALPLLHRAKKKKKKVKTKKYVLSSFLLQILCKMIND